MKRLALSDGYILFPTQNRVIEKYNITIITIIYILLIVIIL